MDTKTFQTSFYNRTAMPTFRRRLLHGRTANFNSLEKRILVQLVEPYKDVVDSKKNDTTTVKEKENIWIHMTRLFNARFPGQKPRESKNLQRLWKNIKSKAKAQNTEIDAMLDAEPTGLQLQQPIKLENQSDGFHEADEQGSRPGSADHLFSTDSCVVKSEMLIATPQSCLPTLVHVGQGNHDRDLQSPITESGKPSSTAGEDSSSRLFAAKRCASAGSSPGMRSGCERNGFDSMGTSEHRVMFDNGGARSEYEDNMLLMKQAEHEQRMKNLKLEREMKQEEHVLRLDVLKEETELVRLRKELLKRQLESYINVVNA